MTGILSDYIKRVTVCLLILFSLGSDGLLAQVKLTSNQNVYKRVTGGAAVGTDFVILNQLDTTNVTADKVFRPGEIVLLIQMKGVKINVPESSSYGATYDKLGVPGYYEFLKILSVDNATKKIVFTRNIVNNFNVKGEIQLIWVPSYPSVDIDSEITCPAWDSTAKVGGVLTMLVGKTLTLNADINVSGKGFQGGAVRSKKGSGICSETGALYSHYAYDTTFYNSGLKGDGIASETDGIPQIYPAYSVGKGANSNSGGGGNGRFSGGGGGSNYGGGGKGGRENPDLCTIPTDAGLGGRQIKSDPYLPGGIYMGGGGGGATFDAGGTSTEGGRGGGIIIILCNDIVGNNHFIKADGLQPSGSPTGLAGAAGGGGGGSVVIYLEAFTSSNLTLSANGGKGGNNTLNNFGEGGGGGGGLIWINSIAVPGNVSRTVTGGAPGTRSGGSTAGSGSLGEILTNYVPVLNGFLFNFIRSSVTNSPVDSICSNQIPYSVTGTNPVPGSGTYTYKWEKKDDHGGPWTDMLINTQNLAFSAAEADTFFVRRIITETTKSIDDVSKEVKIIVQPAIINNNIRIYSNAISMTDTVCYDGDPKIIDQLMPDLGVPTMKNLKFFWYDSVNTVIRDTLPLIHTKSYDPPNGLRKTTWYWRKVVSGRCIDFSDSVRVEVLNSLAGNIISADQDICHGGLFADLTGTVSPTLSGGDPTDYRYSWEVSLTNTAGSWSTSTGIVTGSGYNPPEASPDVEEIKYYRRVVLSGKNDACILPSNSVILTERRKIGDNVIISTNDTICALFPHDSIKAKPLLYGNGIYNITWQENTGSGWVTATGTNPVNQRNYLPKLLSASTQFRRFVTSGACKDSNNLMIATVHNKITNYNISLLSGITDTTICDISAPNALKGLIPAISSGSGVPANNVYEWRYSGSISGPYSTAGGTYSNPDYLPGTLTNSDPLVAQSYYFKRKVTNGKCSALSDSVVIKVLPKIRNNNITPDKAAVCYGLGPVITGSALAGGDTGAPTWIWQESTDGGATWGNSPGGNTQNYNPPGMIVPKQFRRIIWSGPFNTCQSTSAPVSVGINPLPIGTITAAADNTCDNISKPLNITITGSSTGPFRVTYNDGFANVTPPDQAGTGVTLNLTPGTGGSASRTYTYTLVSIRDGNQCDATSLSGSRTLTVYKKPVPQAGGPLGTACGPLFNLAATPSFGTGSWIFPGGVTNTTPLGPSVTVSIDPATQPPQITHRFYWQEINWDITCSGKDSIDVTFYKPVTRPNLGADKTLYLYDHIDSLRAPVPSFGTGKWTALSGGTISKDTDPVTKVSGLYGSESGINYNFVWTVKNVLDLCSEDDTIKYTVYDLVVPKGFSPNHDLNNYNEVFKVKGLDTLYSEVTLKIVNGAGTEVFFVQYQPGGTWKEWDGTNQNGDELPEGTYYYVITIKSLRNAAEKPVKKSGFILLKRYTP